MPTVLLADDNPKLLETYELWLDRLQGTSVRTATDGGEALELLDGRVDAAVLDRRMPNATGGEIGRSIRSRHPDCSIIIVSAFQPDDGIDEADYDRYLTKPVGGEDLMEALRPEVSAPLDEGQGSDADAPGDADRAC